MKITICGSMVFLKQMQETKEKLLQQGHEVKIPLESFTTPDGRTITAEEYHSIRHSGTDEAWVWDKKADAIRTHFNKVEWSDAILVLNYEKRGIEDYVGANTLLEMGLAFHLNKKKFLV